MTDKLITHEEVRINIEINYGILDNYYSDEQSKNSIKKEKQNMLNYITQNEQRDKDVARFMVLLNIYLTDTQTIEEMHERWALERKLSKVGNKL